MAKLAELEEIPAQKNITRNLLQAKLRIAGMGHKAWPSKLAKELLGMTGKTVTKKQTLLNWAKTAKQVLALKSKEQRREKRLENAYEAKKAALTSLIAKFEGWHFPNVILKKPETLNATQLKSTMEQYSESLVERLHES